MLDKLKSFFLTSFIGGIVVLLPVLLTFLIFKFIFTFILKYIHPLSDYLSRYIDFQWLSILLAFIISIGLFFFVGMFIRTRFGLFFHDNIEKYLLKRIPGYKTLKGTITHIVGFNTKTKPFSKVVLVDIYGTGVLMTGVITDDEDENFTTVFIPTTPNPTSGYIYHVPKNQVHVIDSNIEETMKTILALGAGSNTLLSLIKAKDEQNS